MHPKIQMSDEERDAFLRRKRTLRVATNSSDGYPHNVPVGYQYHEGRIYFPSDKKSKKTANMRHDPKVCCIIDEGKAGRDYESLKGVMVQGDVTLYGEEEHDEIKHDDLLRHIFDGEIRGKDRYDRIERVVVEVTPTNVVAWDFSKVNIE
jgi:nitroimidazol reductase NimA-like FMN-containing flavoprotein (pyridoxamine 5'-phosphate oxidase superfamily)